MRLGELFLPPEGGAPRPPDVPDAAVRLEATVAVGGTLPAWSHFIMPSGLFAYL